MAANLEALQPQRRVAREVIAAEITRMVASEGSTTARADSRAAAEREIPEPARTVIIQAMGSVVFGRRVATAAEERRILIREARSCTAEAEAAVRRGVQVTALRRLIVASALTAEATELQTKPTQRPEPQTRAAAAVAAAALVISTTAKPEEAE